ncbi:MAG TPA: 50S ribosomal protein L3 [Candidatus Riflebacteria bacterium]|jgi:large subunit ribosomal protein L3|nr:ribosomal protein L3 [uncultured bacterium]PKL40948.1 MAG: 50S ribosomal protein L3 [Candidatus Riflebacteria bacterium HGW-Riflebacteria-1]HAE39085.1 50S ribosomal protein L3 [Candidatus Riflebacteria bacterium]
MGVKAILGTKVGMTQIFTDDGNVVPVTVISAGPCTIIRKGDSSVQVGYREIRPEAVKRLLNKPLRMSFEKAGVKPFRFVRSLPADELEGIEPNTEINVSMFKEGDQVCVTGTSKGKGFSGAMERHNFNGAQMTHGQSDRARATGSCGSGTQASRTWKGKRLPGQMGNVRKTVKGLKIVKVDEQKNLLLVKGSIPGASNGLVIIRHQA